MGDQPEEKKSTFLSYRDLSDNYNGIEKETSSFRVNITSLFNTHSTEYTSDDVTSYENLFIANTQTDQHSSEENLAKRKENLQQKLKDLEYTDTLIGKKIDAWKQKLKDLESTLSKRAGKRFDELQEKITKMKLELDKLSENSKYIFNSYKTQEAVDQSLPSSRNVLSHKSRHGLTSRTRGKNLGGNNPLLRKNNNNPSMTPTITPSSSSTQPSTTPKPSPVSFCRATQSFFKYGNQEENVHGRRAEKVAKGIFKGLAGLSAASGIIYGLLRAVQRLSSNHPMGKFDHIDIADKIDHSIHQTIADHPDVAIAIAAVIGAAFLTAVGSTLVAILAQKYNPNPEFQNKQHVEPTTQDQQTQNLSPFKNDYQATMDGSPKLYKTL